MTCRSQFSPSTMQISIKCGSSGPMSRVLPYWLDFLILLLLLLSLWVYTIMPGFALIGLRLGTLCMLGKCSACTPALNCSIYLIYYHSYLWYWSLNTRPRECQTSALSLSHILKSSRPVVQVRTWNPLRPAPPGAAPGPVVLQSQWNRSGARGPAVIQALGGEAGGPGLQALPWLQRVLEASPVKNK